MIAKDWFPALDPRLYDFANLPLIVLVATVLGFLLMPALNAISRKHEREADRYAWENTPAIEPFISSMQKLADQNLAEREPNKLSSGSSTRTRRLGNGWRRRRPGPQAARSGQPVSAVKCATLSASDPSYQFKVSEIGDSTEAQNSFHPLQIVLRVHSHGIVRRLGDMNRDAVIEEAQLLQALRALQV